MLAAAALGADGSTVTLAAAALRAEGSTVTPGNPPLDGSRYLARHFELR